MTSIFENTQSKVMIHILHDDMLTELNRKKFIRTAEKYLQAINFVDITEYAERLKAPEMKFMCSRYSAGSLYRLTIPEVLVNLDKVIYLDCDVLVNLDIKELWDIDMENKTLAGAPDFSGSKIDKTIYGEKMRIILNGCSSDGYINAGVLLMDLQRIRERGNLFTIATEWLLSHGTVALAVDQDALNSIFADDIKIISNRFNQNRIKNDMSDCIMHTLWGKPWNFIGGTPSDSMYWKMYLRSAWGENVTPDELIDILNEKAGAKPASVDFKYCLKYVLWRLKTKLKAEIIPTRAIRYLLRYIFYMTKYKFSH